MGLITKYMHYFADLIGRTLVLKLEQTFKGFELRYSSICL